MRIFSLFKFCRIILLAVFLSALTLTFAHAQTATCGNFIYPANYWYIGSATDTLPVTNCNNPFEKTNNLIGFFVNSEPVTDGGTYVVESTGATNYGFAGESYFTATQGDYYRHDGQDYVRVNTRFVEPTREAINAKISEFFIGNPRQADYYTMIYWSNYKWPYFYTNGSYIVDALEGERVQAVFDRMVIYIEDTIKTARQPLVPGTYTVMTVDTDQGPIMIMNTIWQKVLAYIIPTAQAYYYVNTVTFTLTTAPPVPTGASSVLFLPGIEASRLYAGQDAPGVTAFERIWEPGNNSDIQALAMTPDGKSVYDIYTQDIMKVIQLDLVFGYEYNVGDIYAGFSNFMDSLVANSLIHEWYPFAYDWRYDVFDVVKNGTIVNQAGSREYPVSTVEYLASHSFSGQVTIIAHSNGGLLAKALMIELEKEGKADLVDKIIFIGTPQLGTPMAIGTMLHGYGEQEGNGFVVKDTVAREVMNNLPGGYGLLPSQQYIASSSDPIVTFDGSRSTAAYRNLYGATISDFATYKNFLIGDTSEQRSLADKIYQPAPVNVELLNMAFAEHRGLLDSWVAPTSTKVDLIIGTGLPTMKAIRYEDISENICPPNQTAFSMSICTLKREPRPEAVLTHYGDGTVAGLSAQYYPGSADRYFVDLITINTDASKVGSNVKIEHADLTEATPVEDLVRELLFSTSSMPVLPYIVTQEPVVTESYTVQQIASPVQISSTDTAGNTTGLVKENGGWVLKEEIPDSYYFEFAGTKYLLLPATTDFTTTLHGEDYGGFTYTIDTLSPNESQTRVIQMRNILTNPDMIATVEKSSGNYSDLKIDIDGNGSIDRTLALDDKDGEDDTDTYPDTQQSHKPHDNKDDKPGKGERTKVATSTEEHNTSHESLLTPFQKLNALMESIKTKIHSNK